MANTIHAFTGPSLHQVAMPIGGIGTGTTGSGWGDYRQRVSSTTASVTLRVVYGALTLRELSLGGLKPGKNAKLPAGATARRDKAGVTVTFDPPLTLQAGEAVMLKL